MVTKLIDIQLAFPFVLLAIAVIAVAGPSIPVLVVVLAIGAWVGHARIVRGLVLSLRERDYVQAALALGAGTPRILFRHLLPEILSVIVVLATFDVGPDYHSRVDAELPGPRRAAADALAGAPISGTPPSTSARRGGRRRSRGWRSWWWCSDSTCVGDALRDALDPRIRRMTR